MSIDNEEARFEAHDQLYADWQQAGQILEAAASIVQRTDIKSEQDFKIVMHAVSVALQIMIRIWESEEDTMESVDMFKRFREIEENYEALASDLDGKTQ